MFTNQQIRHQAKSKTGLVIADSHFNIPPWLVGFFFSDDWRESRNLHETFHKYYADKLTSEICLCKALH